MSHKIIPFIRNHDQTAAQQAEYYMDIFGDQAQITKTNPVVVTFKIYDQILATLNGGEHPGAILNPSINFSLWINDESETKKIRDRLSDGGSTLMPFDVYPRSPAYGWCNDQYGVSRQVMYTPGKPSNQLIPSFMFIGQNNGKTAEAMEYYTSIFPASKIISTHPYGDNPMGENPTHFAHAEFELVHQLFIALDSGQDHQFQFNDGVSLLVSTDGQEETDYYWEKLTADGGHEVQCGRCKDKF
ncbi:MAG: VOC family protein [Candidatus Peribacteria bacterium]|nr:MAG: VOC family protein [Candidatus Peribacteria bacterium]